MRNKEPEQEEFIPHFTSGSPRTGTSLKEELEHVKESARKEKHTPDYLPKPLSERPHNGQPKQKDNYCKECNLSGMHAHFCSKIEPKQNHNTDIGKMVVGPKQKVCRQCELEGNTGICDRTDCKNHPSLNTWEEEYRSLMIGYGLKLPEILHKELTRFIASQISLAVQKERKQEMYSH